MLVGWIGLNNDVISLEGVVLMWLAQFLSFFFLQALKGFIFVVNACDKIEFVSHNITQYFTNCSQVILVWAICWLFFLLCFLFCSFSSFFCINYQL